MKFPWWFINSQSCNQVILSTTPFISVLRWSSSSVFIEDLVIILIIIITEYVYIYPLSILFLQQSIKIFVFRLFVDFFIKFNIQNADIFIKGTYKQC